MEKKKPPKNPLNKLGIEGRCLIHTNAIYTTLTANITLSGGRRNAFPLRSGIRPGCPVLPLLVSIVLEVLARAIKQDNKIN